MHQLRQIMQRLRKECTWDQRQTPYSLRQYAIEEAYEVAQAIEVGHVDDIKEELGDLLFQVIFQAQLYQEKNAFDFDDVVQTLKEKLIRRHPHVFQAERYGHLSDEQLTTLWHRIKQHEKQEKAAQRSAQEAQRQVSYLNSIKAGPALLQAEAIQTRAADIGFDFPDLASTSAKLDEELAELQQAISEQNQQNIEKEYGDCLFALINVGRQLGVSSEVALLRTIEKFRKRFAYIEYHAQQQGITLEQMSLDDMELLWQQAKTEE